MENMSPKLYIWSILLIASFCSTVCEISITNASISITTEMNSKFSHITIFLCHCNSGEVMNLLGECQLYENSTFVPTLSQPTDKPQLIDTRNFNVSVHMTSCMHPHVYLRENEFIIWVEGYPDLQVIDGPYHGLIVTDYCVHHQWNQGKVKMTAHGCVSVPVVPRCYHTNTSSHANATTLDFNPPLMTGIPPGEEIAGGRFPWESRHEYVDQPICSNGTILKKIELDGQKAYLIALPGIVIFNWSPTVNELPYRFEPQFYCVDLMEDENKYYAFLCHPDLDAYCTNENCIYKCCREGEAYSMEERRCVSSDLPFIAPNSTTANSAITFYTMPICTNNAQRESYLDDVTEYQIFNRSLIHKGVTYPFINYCTDTFLKDDSIESGAIICKEKLKMSYSEIFRFMIYPPCLCISCGFLALLLLLFAWIPKLRENEGMYQLFHALSLLVAFSLQAMLLYFIPEGYTFPGVCVPLAFMMQFSYLSAFFWLNIMCFDVWRLFRKLVQNLYNPVTCIPIWKMMLYGFGGPFTITLITIIVQFVAPRDGYINSLLHPHIGEVRCWFKDALKMIPYFYAPIFLLFVLNLIFIGKTYCSLKIIQKNLSCDIATTGERKNRKTDCVAGFWQQFYLLLLLAGLWLTEFLGLIIPPKEIWIPADVLNCLQGVFIFFVFLRNEKKRGHLKEVLPKILEFTNSWINEADEAQKDIITHNPGLSTTKSPLDIFARFSTNNSFRLNETGKDSEATKNGIKSLSIAYKE